MYVIPSPSLLSSINPSIAPTIDFVYTPNFLYTPNPFVSFCSPYCPFILIGENVNFTATASGGTPPYNYTWNFGDGQTFHTGQTGNRTTIYHTFTSPATYTVKVTVTDSARQTNSISRLVVIHAWPVTHLGWVVHWNITLNDGINIWNVTYHGITVIRDVRLAGVQVIYPNNLCGNFGGPIGAYYMEPGPPAFPPTEQQAKVDGYIFYENSTDPLNPWFQIRAEYRTGGFSFYEAFRFYASGRWSAELIIGKGGCPFDQIYEPHWRFNLATGNDTRNAMSTYTPAGAWKDLVWEGNYTDNGFRDQANNSSQWRFGNQGRYYYITPTIVRSDLDLPYLASNLILVREHPGEIESVGTLTPYAHPGDGIVNPAQYADGELAFRNDITFWFIPRIWDHGPTRSAPPIDINLSFYPNGAWP